MNVTQACQLDEDIAKLHEAGIRKIALIGVNISELPSKWFFNTSVVVLQIRGCPLREISEATVSSISGLSVVRIKQSQLQKVPGGLQAVKYLWLNENPIKFLQGVLLMPELYELDLSCNEIGGIDEGYFSLSTNLQVLKLNGNKIHHLPAGIFRRTKKLKRIHLRDSSIHAIGSEFHQLRYLEVSSVEEL
ncbi:hypothetical protein MTO96_018584 [Rhipicephalus appendiculatus]